MKHLFTILFSVLILSVKLNAQTVQIGTTSYQTIAEAIAAAADGDVIEIRGIHTESLVINKSLTLRGADPLLDKIQAAETAGTASTGVVTVARIDGLAPPLNFTMENLGIRYGVNPENGGGISIDKLEAKATLRNIIIEENSTAKNGGGLSVAGTDVDIIDCTIIGNSSTLDGGGVILAPNNAASGDSFIKITNSLIDSNIGRNGGGLYINGNKGFGNNHRIQVDIVNATISSNISTSGSTGNGGGGIWSKSAVWLGGTAEGNVDLNMVHVTMYNNDHTGSAIRNGIQFLSDPAGASLTNFTLYNSIIVSADDVNEKSLNFVNANTINAVNNIIGGTNSPPAWLNDAEKNNKTGRTATFSGISTSLTNEGGNVKVFALTQGANSIDNCTIATGIELPATDARGVTRDATPDAGAFEFVAPNEAPTVANPIDDKALLVGFGSTTVDLSTVFSDANGDVLALEAVSGNLNVVTVSITDNTLTITEVGPGSSTITVTANDGKEGVVNDEFIVTVSANNNPTVANAIEDKLFQTGFSSSVVDLTNIFADADNDVLSLSVAVDNANVLTAVISGNELTLTEVGAGYAKVTVTADDQKGGTVAEEFFVRVNRAPVVANPIADQELTKGFGTVNINIGNVFTDADDNTLELSVISSNESILTAAISGTTLTLTEVGVGPVNITVTASDGFGGTAEDVAAVEIIVVLSANELPKLELYPNPAQSFLHLNIQDESVIIMGANGKKETLPMIEGMVDVSHLSKGMYVLYVPSLKSGLRFLKN